MAAKRPAALPGPAVFKVFLDTPDPARMYMWRLNPEVIRTYSTDLAFSQLSVRFERLADGGEERS